MTFLDALKIKYPEMTEQEIIDNKCPSDVCDFIHCFDCLYDRKCKECLNIEIPFKSETDERIAAYQLEEGLIDKVGIFLDNSIFKRNNLPDKFTELIRNRFNRKM